MKKYYLHDGQIQLGPFDLDELKAKNVSSDTHVWFDTLEDWTSAGKIDELKELFKITPPPFKTLSENQPLQDENSKLPPLFAQSKIVKEETETKTKNGLKPLHYIVSASVLFAFLIIFLVYKNIQHTRELEIVKEENSTLNNQVSSVQQDLKAKEEQKKIEEEGTQNRLAVIAAREIGYRNNWSKFIQAFTGTYSVSGLGGISNLGVTIVNETEYMIDEVVVEVEYIKANGENHKTEILTITNLASSNKKRVDAPNSDRGTSVRLHIKGITARSFHFCFDKYGNGNGNPSDPWQCN